MPSHHQGIKKKRKVVSDHFGQSLHDRHPGMSSGFAIPTCGSKFVAVSLKGQASPTSALLRRGRLRSKLASHSLRWQAGATATETSIRVASASCGNHPTNRSTRRQPATLLGALRHTVPTPRVTKGVGLNEDIHKLLRSSLYWAHHVSIRSRYRSFSLARHLGTRVWPSVRHLCASVACDLVHPISIVRLMRRQHTFLTRLLPQFRAVVVCHCRWRSRGLHCVLANANSTQ